MYHGAVTNHQGPLVDGCVLTVAARANNGEQLALADGFGRVRLLRYPAVNDDQVAERSLIILELSSFIRVHLSTLLFTLNRYSTIVPEQWLTHRRTIGSGGGKVITLLGEASTHVRGAHVRPRTIPAMHPQCRFFVQNELNVNKG